MNGKSRLVVLITMVSVGAASSGCSELAQIIHPKQSASQRDEEAAAKQSQRIAGFRQAIATSTCDALFDTYQKHRGDMEHYDDKSAEETRVALARKFVECKKTPEMFSCLGNVIGPRYFDAAQKAGVDMIGEMKSYLSSQHPKGLFHDTQCVDDNEISNREVYKWARGRSESLCAEFEGAMDGGDPLARASITAGYLLDKSCDGGAERARPGLQADPHWAIESTCTYLGKYGDASYISDLETVAQAHNDAVVDGGRVFIPVHDVCLQAAAKLKLKKDAPGSSSKKPGASQ